MYVTDWFWDSLQMPLEVKLVLFMKLHLTVVRFHILTATSNLVMIEK